MIVKKHQTAFKKSRVLPGIFTVGLASIILVMGTALSQNVNAEQPAPTIQKTASEISEDALIELLKTDVPDVAVEDKKTTDSWKIVRMRVTAYCPCSQCCGEFADGITANNHRIQPGDKFVAADKTYPFGTEMVVPGYNGSQPVEVKDRGGAIKGSRLDLFFHTHQAALEWGVQYLDVRVKIK